MRVQYAAAQQISGPRNLLSHLRNSNVRAVRPRREGTESGRL